MSKMEIAGALIEVDEEGYLVNFEDWNEQVACALAEGAGIKDQCPLTQEKNGYIKILARLLPKISLFSDRPGGM